MRTKIAQCETLRLELSGLCRRNLRWIGHFFALILLPSLAGCFSTGEIKPYPSTWPAVATTPSGQCPNISGEYQNSGDWNAESGSCGGKHPAKAAWNCDSSLAGNLVKMKAVDFDELLGARNAYTIKLQQPDPDTLEVYFPSESSPPKIFKRSQGDFDCDSSSLKFSTTGTVFSDEKSSTLHDVGITAAELLLLPGAAGVVSTERVFRPLQDGSLSMEATESVWFTWLAILNVHRKSNPFVRWERFQPASPEKTSRPHLTTAYVSAADYTKFQTLDGKPGYNIHCARYGTVMPCSPKAYEEADALCEDKGYSVVSADYKGASIQDEVFTLVVQCKY